MAPPSSLPPQSSSPILPTRPVRAPSAPTRMSLLDLSRSAAMDRSDSSVNPRQSLRALMAPFGSQERRAINGDHLLAVIDDALELLGNSGAADSGTADSGTAGIGARAQRNRRRMTPREDQPPTN